MAPAAPRDPWQGLRARRRAFYGTWFGGFVVLIALIALQSVLPIPSSIMMVLAISWLAGFALSWAEYANWPCPRCGKSFVGKRYHFSHETCEACGLERYSPIHTSV